MVQAGRAGDAVVRVADRAGLSGLTREAAREAFTAAVARFDPARPVLVLCHHDADGLAAGAILTRAFPGAAARVIGRGEGDAGRRVPPKVAGDMALIRLTSPCQIHPLVAQSWVTRLREGRDLRE